MFGAGPPEPTATIANGLDSEVEVYRQKADGERGSGILLSPGELVTISACVSRPTGLPPYVAAVVDSGEVIDTWSEGLCDGDHWAIPQGGRLENRTSREVLIVGDNWESRTFRLGPGSVGTVAAPCVEGPIRAQPDEPPGADAIAVWGTALCEGDVWVIGEP